MQGHDSEKCDIIVCWRHNWVKCRKEIEVIELSGIVDPGDPLVTRMTGVESPAIVQRFADFRQFVAFDFSLKIDCH